MKKSFPYVLILLFIFMAFLVQVQTILYLNKAKNEYAQELLRKGSEGSENKLLYLTQSNILQPSNNKKIMIIELYLKNGDFQKAEKYLKKVKSEEGYIKYAETALEVNKPELAQNYIQKIKDPEKKQELELFSEFIQGKTKSLESLSANPSTNVGKFLLALNTETYLNLPNTLLGQKVNLIDLREVNKLTAQQMIASLMINNNQPNIAKFLIEEIKSKSLNGEVYDLESLLYEQTGDYKRALESSLKSLEYEPENIEKTQRAITLAARVGEKETVSYLNQRLKRLNEINN